MLDPYECTYRLVKVLHLGDKPMEVAIRITPKGKRTPLVLTANNPAMAFNAVGLWIGEGCPDSEEIRASKR